MEVKWNMKKRTEILRVLENIVGADSVTDEEFVLESYSRDLSESSPKRAEFVVRPRTAPQVSLIIQVANRYKIPVYVRGGGTGHYGACLPVQGGIVLDMTQMNKIIKIDKRNLIVHVQAGCTWHKLNQELKKERLTLLPREMGGFAMTIGASASKSGAGPVGCAKRGPMGLKDILGLQIVLPTGEIVRTNPIADVSGIGFGPSLTGLYVGSAGTLGVITEVYLRISPMPEAEEYLYFVFKRYQDVEKVADAVTRRVGDELTFSFSTFQTASNLKEVPAYMWVQGSKEECRSKSSQIKRICVNSHGKEGDPNEGEAYYEMAWGKLRDYFAKGVIEYVGGWCPIYSIHVFNEAWREVVIEKHDFRSDTSGFTGWLITRGWGFNGQFCYYEPSEWEEMRVVADELAKRYLALGAVPRQIGGPSVSMYLGWREHAGLYYEVIKKIKKALDPNDILNPGVMIP